MLSVTVSDVLVIQFIPAGKDVERYDLADSSVKYLVRGFTCRGVFRDNHMVVSSFSVLLFGIEEDKSLPGDQISILNTAINHIGVDLSNHNSHDILRLLNRIDGLVVGTFDAVDKIWKV